MNYIPSYGQSLSMGGFGTPSISQVQRFDSLMFAGGTLPQGYSSDLDSDYGTATSLIEFNGQSGFDSDVYGTVAPGETILSGLTEAIKELMASEDNATVANFPDYRLLGSCPGHGEYTIGQLSQGTVPYQRLLYEVQAAMAIAKQMGLTFGVPLITWMQGEEDICCDVPGNYATSLAQLIQQQLNVDIPALTGQAGPPLFLMYQTAQVGGFEIACEQYYVGQTVPGSRIATPCYPFANSETPHLTAAGYKQHGAYFGAAFKKIVIDGEQWTPLSPIAVTANGNMVTVSLHVPYGPVVADTQNVTATNPAKAAFGFTLTDESNEAIGIESVTIDSSNNIVIAAAAAVTDGCRVNYGYTVDGTSGGNIRDSQGNVYVFNGGGLDYPMHNWLVMFSLPVGGKSATVVAITSTAAVVAGTQATITAAVSSAQALPLITGQVTFAVNGVMLGGAVVSAGSASLTLNTSGIAAGTYVMEAVYSGDGSFLPSSATADVTVELAATSSTLTLSANAVSQGEAITLSNAVQRTSAGGRLTGMVTFFADGEAIGSAPVVDGTAVLTVTPDGSFAPGKYSLTAGYSGDAGDQPSVSPTVIATLLAATGISFAALPNPVPPDSECAFQAVVTQLYGSAVPAGQVTFAVNGYSVASVPVGAGGIAQASVSDTGISPGTYSITASYSGDASNGPAISAPVAVIVQ